MRSKDNHEHDHDHDHEHSTEEEDLFCDTCGQQFETEEELKKHEKSYHMDFIWKIKDKIKAITG